MTAPHATAHRRQWSDVAVILVGVVLLALSIWGGPILSGQDDELAYAKLVWLVYAGAGALCVAGVLVAQKWAMRGLGRALIIIAALGLLASLFAFQQFGWRAWLTTLLPATVLLVASRYLGPIPPPG